MAEPDNIVLAQLRNLRETLEILRRDQEALTRRFDSIRQAVNGESFLGRVTAAEIEDRLAAMDARLTALEDKQR